MSIIIVDYGSQYSQLIARRIRQKHVFCKLIHPNEIKNHLNDDSIKGWILSGGPASAAYSDKIEIPFDIFKTGIPVLGICFGFHLIIKAFDGIVHPSKNREYGPAVLSKLEHDSLFDGVSFPTKVWMSHGDSVERLPECFIGTSATSNGIISSFRHKDKHIFGLQFHPEVYHTEKGAVILKNFLFDISKCTPDWTMENLIKRLKKEIQEKVGDGKVISALSGGVDSSVMATLIHQAIGDKFNAVFVDNGLLRKDEKEQVQKIFKEDLGINVHIEDASHEFLTKLKGVTDPEIKRKIIGHIFIDVFDRIALTISGVTHLAQGTLYPDVIESASNIGPSAVIKSHHNVGGLPKNMNLSLIEPLRNLFKDEVREIGSVMGLTDAVIGRHPFPGPGLAIRCLGEITPDKLQILRESDYIAIEEIRRAGYYDKVWQAFTVLLPVRSVGVMGDSRTYEYSCVLRVVESTDAMTADWARLPYDLLSIISNRIVNEVKGINRVVYDITTKPPGTIEWE